MAESQIVNNEGVNLWHSTQEKIKLITETYFYMDIECKYYIYMIIVLFIKKKKKSEKKKKN